jgi:hypothetical protein
MSPIRSIRSDKNGNVMSTRGNDLLRNLRPMDVYNNIMAATDVLGRLRHHELLCGRDAL